MASPLPVPDILGYRKDLRHSLAASAAHCCRRSRHTHGDKLPNLLCLTWEFVFLIDCLLWASCACGLPQAICHKGWEYHTAYSNANPSDTYSSGATGMTDFPVKEAMRLASRSLFLPPTGSPQLLSQALSSGMVRPPALPESLAASILALTAARSTSEALTRGLAAPVALGARSAGGGGGLCDGGAVVVC